MQALFKYRETGGRKWLDNLKLGYGGTKEEMQRLIADANKVKEANGEMADLSIDSFADVAEAIHIIQSEMGITGTTAREAATTIQGSLSMMKGAWTNLVVGMADENANMDVLIGNFVESVETAAKNLLPRIKQILIGIGDLITKLAPVIADALPVLVEAVLPSLLSAAVSLVTALVKGIITALPAVYDALLIGVQTILVEVFGVSEEKAKGFADGVTSFFVKIKDGFMALVKSAQTEGTSLNKVWTGIKETVQTLGEFLTAIWDAASAAFSWCVDQMNTEGTFLNKMMGMIWNGIKDRISLTIDIIKGVISVFTAVLRGDWSGAWEAIQNITQTIFDAICDKVNGGLEFLKSICPEGLRTLLDSFGSIWNRIVETVRNCIDNIKSHGDSLNGIWQWLQEAAQKLGNFLADVFDFISVAFTTIVEGFEGDGEWLQRIWTSLKDAVQSMSDYFSKVWQVISSAFKWCVEEIVGDGEWLKEIWVKIQDTAATISEYIAAYWEALSSAFSWCVEQINTEGTFLNKVFNGIKEYASVVFSNLKAIISTAVDVIKGIFATFTAILKGDWEGALTAMKNTAQSIWDAIRKCWSNVGTWFNNNVVKPIKEKVVDPISTALDNMKKKFSDIWNGCKKIVTDAITALKNALKFDWSLPKLKLPHISVSGGEAPYGIGGKGSLPHFSIEWYKKAYDNAMVLSSPTIFGFGGGSFLGGGDGNGNEIVAGESHLMNLIGQVVESKTAGQNERIIALLSALLTATVDGNEEMIRAVLAGGKFVVGEREFARLVKTYA